MISELSTPLIKNLRLIRSIRPGYTISTSNRSLVRRKSWITAYTRRYHQDNRLKTIAFVKETIKEVITLITNVVSLRNSYLSHLILAKKGIRNLAQTYSDDVNIGIECSNLLGDIDEYLRKLDFDMPLILPQTGLEEPHQVKASINYHRWLPKEAFVSSWPN